MAIQRCWQRWGRCRTLCMNSEGAKPTWTAVLPQCKTIGSHLEHECKHTCAYTHICTWKVTQGSVNQLVKCTLIRNVNFFISECTCKIVPNGILHFQCRSHNAAIPYYDFPSITVMAFQWIWEYIFNYLTFQPHSFLFSLPLFWLLQSMKVKIKGKVFPTNPVMSNSGNWSIDPLLLKLSTIRRRVVSLKTWQLQLQVKAFGMQ